VIATELTSPRCRAIESYAVAPDESLRIRFDDGDGATFDHVEVTEYDDRVELGLVVQAFNGPVAGTGHTAEQTVTLGRPLAGRRLIDATTRKAIPRR
jgi:hypothetical protein